MVNSVPVLQSAQFDNPNPKEHTFTKFKPINFLDVKCYSTGVWIAGVLMTFWSGDSSSGELLILIVWLLWTFTDLICLMLRLVEGVLFSLIGIVGFLGNTLSIIVLISPQVDKNHIVIFLTTKKTLYCSCGNIHLTACWLPWQCSTSCLSLPPSPSMRSLCSSIVTGCLRPFTVGNY